MNKKLIRLTESDLHRIVKESVNRVLNEIHNNTLEENQQDENFLGLFGSKEPKRRFSHNTKAELERDYNRIATQRNRENNRVMRNALNNGKISQDQYNQHRNPYNGKKMMYGK